MTDRSDESVVIVGAGQAGAWVAITLREHDGERPITLIGDEPYPPYERPPLSKGVLRGDAELESAFIRPADYYSQNGVELIVEKTVESIDREAREVVLSDGMRLPYGCLVLTTGCRARQIPLSGIDLPQVHVLRSAADADAIGPALTDGCRFVAIGAGFIGLEAAAVASKAGCSVTVLEAADAPLRRAIDPEVAASISALHERQGVSIRCDVDIDAIEAAGEHAEIVLAGGERLAADIVVLGVGAVPDTGLAEAAGLECDDGIVVDEFGRTSDPAIWAAGDVTRHFNPALGRRIRLESWQNAQNQGKAVGRAIAGAGEPYAEIPWFWTDQYGSNFQIIGAPERWDRIIWRGAPDDDKFTVLYLADDRVVAGNTMNNPRDIRAIRTLIEGAHRIADATLADMSLSLVKIVKQQDA